MTDLQIREASSEDIPGILETLRLSLGESPLLRRSGDLWRWKHHDNPFGRSIVLVAASVSGEIAGVRAFMRWTLRHGVNEVDCVRPVDTATHPAFRRRGIFRTLTMSAVEAARQDQVQLIFNTPNEKSAPGYADMGWKQVGSIGVQVRPRIGHTTKTAEHALANIASWAPGADDITAISETRSTREDDDRLQTSSRPGYALWRYGSHPYASYGWVRSADDTGLIVRASIRGGRPELVVVDFHGRPAPKSIRIAARISRARYMAGWFSPGTARRRASIAGGLLPMPGVKTLQLMANPLRDLDLDPLDLGSWNLGTGDLELL